MKLALVGMFVMTCSLPAITVGLLTHYAPVFFTGMGLFSAGPVIAFLGLVVLFWRD